MLSGVAGCRRFWIHCDRGRQRGFQIRPNLISRTWQPCRQLNRLPSRNAAASLTDFVQLGDLVVVARDFLVDPATPLRKQSFRRTGNGDRRPPFTFSRCAAAVNRYPESYLLVFTPSSLVRGAAINASMPRVAHRSGNHTQRPSPAAPHQYVHTCANGNGFHVGKSLALTIHWASSSSGC
jgi:hypothetical protein